MQAQGERGNLVQQATQEIIGALDDDDKITLITNDNQWKDVSLGSIKNELLGIHFSPNELPYETALLRATSFIENTTSSKHLFFISDFQNNHPLPPQEIDSTITYHPIQLRPNKQNNIAIDSLAIENDLEDYTTISVFISASEPQNKVTVSLREKGLLSSKTAIELTPEGMATFQIPSQTQFNGSVSIEDNSLPHDNELFFSIQRPDKIKVMAINEADDTFLKKLYPSDEFLLTTTDYASVDFGLLPDQHLLILNELEALSESLRVAIQSFVDSGGSLLVIPNKSSNTDSYNTLLSSFGYRYESPSNSAQLITEIKTSHPLLDNVFESNVSNFQYPKVNSYFPLKSGPGNPSILMFQDQTPFLTNYNHVYIFTASISEENSNFKQSPLIVPIFYNIARQSLQLPVPYYTIGRPNEIEIPYAMQRDQTLELVSKELSIIPLQRAYNTKTRITVTDEIPLAGTYALVHDNTTLENISFNYSRNESVLQYHPSQSIENLSGKTLKDTLLSVKYEGSIQGYWKWFVIFALVFLVIEMLILKYLS